MDAIECIKTRRSIRTYKDEAISRDTIREIIDVARMAPTWKNSQTLRYVVVEDKEVIKKIAQEATLGFEHNNGIISKCASLVVITQINGRCGYEKDGSFTTSKGAGWEMFDAGIAAQTFCLAAHEKGVGSCILGIFDDKKVAEIIGLEEGKTVTTLIPIGYPESVPNPTPRKEIDDLLTFI
ncbi:MAG: nitroreductase family protein [Lachnospiraceae bacterium]|nr:nitroreductase family protein [Lachnospiraceae bacterium]MBQ9608316.1 nitroreductase family protein [Lachnospiraceae bacterium]